MFRNGKNATITGLTISLMLAVWVIIHQAQSPSSLAQLEQATSFAAYKRKANVDAALLVERQREIELMEKGTSALRQARARVAEAGATIPREAAICLDARRQVDADLVDAMQPGKEFGLQLDTWHIQSRVINFYCDYALKIEAVK